MGKIKDLPLLERPREKAYRYGIDHLSDYELIALLIGSGCVDNSANDIAYEMIRDAGGLSRLVERPYRDLLNYKGIGKNKAIKIMASFEIAKRCQSRRKDEEKESVDSKTLFTRFYPLLKEAKQEYVFLVVLDKKKHIVFEVNLYKGNENSVNYSKLQILKEVLVHDGTYFYIVHNHPSGSLEPSQDDVFFTTLIIQESSKLKVTLLDHLIISSEGYYSFLSQRANSVDELRTNEGLFEQNSKSEKMIC